MLSAEQEEQQLFRQHQQQIVSASTAESFRDHLDSYIRILVSGSPQHSTYFDSFVQHGILRELMQRLVSNKFAGAYFQAVFHNLQILIKSLKREQETLYLATYLHKEGYLSEKYDFDKEPQAEYFVLIVKSLLRTMLMHDQRFVNIFANVRNPYCPIAYNMMRFYNFTEQHVATASKYVLLELSSHPNAQSPYMKVYFVNFPFVSYYVHLCLFLKDTFDSTLLSMSASDIEHLVLQIVFMEEIVGNKGSQTINIYSNSVFFVIVRHIFKLIVEGKQPTGKVLKLFLQIVKRVKVEKIRHGLRLMLRQQIDTAFEQYLLEKDIEVSSYSRKFRSRGFFDDYLYYIEQHCRCLYTGDYKKQQSRLFRALTSLNSYVSANECWIEAEMQRLSSIIGVQIIYGNPINHDKHLPDSFLLHLDREALTLKENRLYRTLMDQSKTNQGVYHILLLLFREIGLKDQFVNDLKSHVVLLTQCQSLSPLIAAAWIVSNNQFELSGQQKTFLNDTFRLIIDKLLNYVLDEGWNNLIRACERLQKTSLALLEDDFQIGIFRDVDCDVLTLLILRGLLGITDISKNLEDFLRKQHTGRTTQINTGTKICCSLNSESSTNHYLKVESQYIRFYTSKDDAVGDYSIKRYKLYEDPTCPSIVEFVSESKESSDSFTLYFSDSKLSQYFQELFKTMRTRITQFELELYSLNFQLFPSK